MLTMNDYRNRIGSNAQFDDARYWSFERRLTGPPLHFDRSWFDRYGDVAVVATSIIILVAIVIGIII